MEKEEETKLQESPESGAFPLFLLTFDWITPLMWKGFWKSLDEEDLFDLQKKDKAVRISKKLEEQWNSVKNSRFALTFALIKTFGLRFIFAGLLKLIMDICNLCQPLILREILAFLAEPRMKLEIGMYWIILLFGINVLSSVIGNQYFHIVLNIGMRIRTGLTTVIYRKALKLSNSARQRRTTGEITNLMSIDVQKISQTLTYLHMIWSGLFQIIFCLVSLFVLIGWVTIAGVFVMFLLIPIQGVSTRIVQKLRKLVLKYTDERVKTVNEILQGIRIIKFFTWESPFMKKIANIRKSEVWQFIKTALFGGVLSAIMTSSPIMVSVSTFLLYALMGNQLVPAIVFPSLAYFNLLRFPLTFFPMIIGWIVDCSVSIGRIQDYLQDGELEKYPSGEDEEYPVKVDDANFEWGSIDTNKEEKGEKETVHLVDDVEVPEQVEDTTGKLLDVNFQIRKGDLVIIVGTVGSGKSSLLFGLLGEMNKISGNVGITGSIAYCPQQAWIQNATVRDNITFGNDYKEEKMNKIVDICALKEDFKILAAGDMTEIGERGINLSGGQRQRVSIARAVYTDADIYLLDDPLSAVDAHVGKHIFENCIQGELKGKTRLLVTHQLQYLPQADYVIVMDQGRIVEQGTYEYHQKNPGLLASMMKKFVAEEGEGESEEIIEEIEEEKNEEKVIEVVEEKKESKIISTEERVRGGLSFYTIWGYIKRMGGIPIIFLHAFLFIMAQASLVSADWWLSNWSSGTFNVGLGVNLGVYVALGFAGAIFVLIRNVSFLMTGLYAATRLHNSMLKRIMGAPMSFFDSTPLGRIISRFSKDQEVADTQIIPSIQSFLQTLFQVISTFIIIAYVNYWFIVPLVPILVVYVIIQQIYRRTSRELRRIDSITRSPLFSHFSETLNGLSTIRAYNRQISFIKTNFDKVDTNQRANYPQLAVQRWLAVRLEFIGAIIIFIAALFGVLTKGTLSAGLVGLSLTYALQISGSLSWCVRQATEAENSMNAIERLIHYCENIELESTLDTHPPQLWPQLGDIVFKNFQMRYRPELPLILNGLNLHIKGGDSVGVVGRTGAGKSSMMLALFRMVEGCGGFIEIDDVDISTISLHDLRKNISIIPQEPIMFAGTVRSNLDPFDEFSDAFLWDCLEKAYLKDTIEGLPNQLQSNVAEGGENFSVGQRQLMCLARALCKNSKLLILDEATASVDMETDALIQKTVKEQFKHCTKLIIAHRLNTIIDCNKILVMDKGQVGEYDTPKKLVQKENGLFLSMLNETGNANANQLKNIALNQNKK